MKNVGKIFEENFKKSVPTDVYYYRLHDAPQSFNKTDSLRFSWKNPYDCMLYDGKSRTLYTLELKTSGTKSFSFELEKGTNKTANIHYHQIESLRNVAKYEGIVCGFIFNFRYQNVKTKEAEEVTYFQSIDDFDEMISNLNKKSFNIADLVKYHPIKIDQKKKKVNYTYNIEKFIEDTSLTLNN